MKHLLGSVSWLPFFAAEAEGGAAAEGEGGTPTPKLGEGTPTPKEPEPVEVEEEGEAPEPEKKPWYTKRFDELTGKWRDEERQHAQTKTELALAKAEAEALRKGVKPEGEEKPASAAAPAKDPNLVPRSEVTRLAKEEASRLAAEAEFNKSCNEVFAKGKEEFKDFDKKIGAFGQLTSGHSDPVAFGNYMNLISASLELGDDSSKVLYALGSDMDEAARVMSLPPIKMGVELTRIASRLNTGKPLSQAPAPIRPVRGAARAEPRLDDPNLDTGEWIKLRNKQLAEKRANGG